MLGTYVYHGAHASTGRLEALQGMAVYELLLERRGLALEGRHLAQADNEPDRRESKESRAHCPRTERNWDRYQKQIEMNQGRKLLRLSQKPRMIGADGGSFPRADIHSFIHDGEWCT
jgi:hypothetical protein